MADRNEIVEQLFEAIDAIAIKRLENVQFDKTIIGTITDNSRADYGRYQVTTDNNIRFTAYSDIVTYGIGDKVYIRIPDNDYTKQKVIIDRYIPDNQNTMVQETKLKQVELLKDDFTTTKRSNTYEHDYMQKDYRKLINDEHNYIETLRKKFEEAISDIRIQLRIINERLNTIDNDIIVINNDIVEINDKIETINRGLESTKADIVSINNRLRNIRQ